MLNKIKNKLESTQNIKITAIGDSLTEGWMVEKGYIDFIEEAINNKYLNAKLKIENRGVAGNCAHESLSRIKHYPIQKNPDLIIIQFGLNDAFSGLSPKNYKNNINEMIKFLKKDCNCEILLISSTPYFNPAGIDIMNYFYKELESIANNKSIFYLKIHEKWKNAIQNGLKEHELLQVDGVHPTEEGYKIMANAIIQIL